MKQTSLSVPPVARPSRTAAFTLIELLSVVAIIGILAAILIPTVGSVRASANQAACSANLRQLSLAVLMYAKDNRDTLPSGYDSSTGKYTGIFRSIRDPSPGAGAVSYTPSTAQLSYHINKYLEIGRTGSVWRDPGNVLAQEASTSNGANPNNSLSYLVNNRGTNFLNYTSPAAFFGRPSTTTSDSASVQAQARPKRLSEILAAAVSTNTNKTADGRLWSSATGHDQIWMLSDIDSINYSGSDGIPASTAANAIPMPHKGGRNYAFFDGHVELRKADNLPANP